MRGIVRAVVWLLVLAGVFVFGIGMGRTVAGDGARGTAHAVHLVADRGVVTATLPTKTVVTTVVETKTVKVKVPAKRKH
jgi:hypothetical protein